MVVLKAQSENKLTDQTNHLEAPDMLTDTVLFLVHIPRHREKSHLTINIMMDSIALQLWFQSCWVCGLFVMAYLNMIKMCHKAISVEKNH